MKLFHELKRRNVHRVAAAYALVAWIVIEAGSVLLPTFGAPEWLFRAYVIAVAAGFVVALVIAWIFEVTPEGVRLERDVDRETYQPPVNTRLNYGIIALLVIALGISLTFNMTGMRDRHEARIATEQKDSVAVLPFSSLSADPDNRFFTDGIHADLLTRLSETGSLRVISGTSVAEYRDTKKNVRQIGQELGVSTIVEGAIQRSGDQVRITVQLVDAGTDEPIWSDSFDRALTMQNVFDVQRQISTKIATSLRSALTPEEQQRIAKPPATNVEAYANYVQGRNNLYQRHFDGLLLARQQFEEAISIDPGYAQAYAALAETVIVLYTNHNALTASDAFEQSEAAVEKALRLDSELAEAHAVRGLIEYSRWKLTRKGDGNQRAAAAFEHALSLNPNLANAYIWFSSLRDSELDTEGAIELLTRAMKIDPLGRIPYLNLPGMYAAQGDNDRAVETWLKAVVIFPDWASPVMYVAEHLQKLGRLDEALAWYMQAQPLTNDPMSGAPLIGIYLTFGMDEPLQEWFESFPEDHPIYPLGVGFWQFVNGEYSAALETLNAIPNIDELPADLVYRLMAVSAIFLQDYDQAFDYIVRGNPTLTSDSSNVVNRFNVGEALMFAYIQQKRGRPSEAARILQQAEAAIAEIPRLGRLGHGIRDVQLLALQGRKEAALDHLREAVDEGFVSLASFEIWELDIDPLTESLRDEPRFREMRREMEERIEIMRQSAETAAENNDWASLRARVEST